MTTTSTESTLTESTPTESTPSVAAPTIVAVGEAMIELTNNADDSLAWTFAGDSLNAAAAAAAAAPDASVQYLTGIGEDARSRTFVEFCDELGVNARNSPVVADHHLGMYWVETDGDERWFQYWRHDSAARVALSAGPTLPPLGRGDAVLASGITLAVAGAGLDSLIEQLATARAAGATVAFDTNYRPALWNGPTEARAAADRACAVATIIVASADDLAAMWGETPDMFCARVGHDDNEVIVTDGPRQVTASLNSNTVVESPPATVSVDPTGAGDAFFGTYVGTRVAGRPADVAIREALEAGAAAVRSPGALGHLRHRR